MNKKSLEENRAYILGELPGKFQQAFEAEVAKATEIPEGLEDNDLERIKAELRSHPNADGDVLPEIDPNAHRSLPPLSEAEQRSAMAEELQRTKEAISRTAAN